MNDNDGKFYSNSDDVFQSEIKILLSILKMVDSIDNKSLFGSLVIYVLVNIMSLKMVTLSYFNEYLLDVVKDNFDCIKFEKKVLKELNDYLIQCSKVDNDDDLVVLSSITLNLLRICQIRKTFFSQYVKYWSRTIMGIAYSLSVPQVDDYHEVKLLIEHDIKKLRRKFLVN